MYCYGSQEGCLWDKKDCKSDEDCEKYLSSTNSTNKYTDGEELNCIKTPSGWRSEACACGPERGGWYLLCICYD